MTKRPRLSAPADHNPTTPSASPPGGELRVIGKREVCRRVGRSPATIWLWMRLGVFPRSRNLRGRPVWYEHEITAFLRALSVVPLKGDGD